MRELTVRELAEREGITPRMVYTRIDAGEIQTRRTPGGGIRIPVDEPAGPRHGYECCGVYFFRSEDYIKIGYAVDVRTRYQAVRCLNPHAVVPLGFIPCESQEAARQIEEAWHARFAHLHHRYEWFRSDLSLIAQIAAEASQWPAKRGES